MGDFLNQFWAQILVSFVMVVGLAIHLRKNPMARDPRETALNIFIYLVGASLQIAVIDGFQIHLFENLRPFALFELPATGVTWILAYVAVDFAYYWRHRAEHYFPLLWAEHCVHHSSPEFNLSTAGRLSWIMIAFGWIGYLPLVLFGFEPSQIILCWSINMAFQFLSHLDGVGTLGFLDDIFSTPSNHRVHHAENALYWGKNLGGTFIIWDRLFGTYQPLTEPARLGGRLDLRSLNPIHVNFNPMYEYLLATLLTRRRASLR